VSLIVVDTDVASTLLRRRASLALGLQIAGHTIAITFVTDGELTGPRAWHATRRG
jgi:hypothetical protein